MPKRGEGVRTRTSWLIGPLAALCLAGCASRETMVALQRPPIAGARAFIAPADHPLTGAVTIDYISGMSQHSFFFAEANQNAFRPMLGEALASSGLMAPTPVAARYGLQIEFQDLRGAFVGVDLKSRSRATYRIVERATGRVVFERTVDAAFLARYRGLTEDDAVAATLVGPLAPLGVLWPGNFIAPGNFMGQDANVRARGTLTGDLAAEGVGARGGFARAKQADYQMMRQSIAKFLIGLSEDQAIEMTTIIPCNARDEVRGVLMAQGAPWRTDNCLAYPRVTTVSAPARVIE
jgi:hypothetical protein